MKVVSGTAAAALILAPSVLATPFAQYESEHQYGGESSHHQQHEETMGGGSYPHEMPHGEEMGEMPPQYGKHAEQMSHGMRMADQFQHGQIPPEMMKHMPPPQYMQMANAIQSGRVPPEVMKKIQSQHMASMPPEVSEGYPQGGEHEHREHPVHPMRRRSVNGDLYTREAEPDPYADAEAEAEADEDDWLDDGPGLHARSLDSEFDLYARDASASLDDEVLDTRRLMARDANPQGIFGLGKVAVEVGEKGASSAGKFWKNHHSGSFEAASRVAAKYEKQPLLAQKGTSLSASAPKPQKWSLFKKKPAPLPAAGTVPLGKLGPLKKGEVPPPPPPGQPRKGLFGMKKTDGKPGAPGAPGDPTKEGEQKKPGWFSRHSNELMMAGMILPGMGSLIPSGSKKNGTDGDKSGGDKGGQQGGANAQGGPPKPPPPGAPGAPVTPPKPPGGSPMPGPMKKMKRDLAYLDYLNLLMPRDAEPDADADAEAEADADADESVDDDGLWARDAEAEADEYPDEDGLWARDADAEADDHLDDNTLWARDATAEVDDYLDDDGLWARDADVDGDEYFDGNGLWARDADAYPYPDAYAEPGPEADPEAWAEPEDFDGDIYGTEY